MTLEEIQESIIDLLPYYLQKGRNINVIIKVLSRQFLDLHNASEEIRLYRDIDNSQLFGLDIIGDEVGEKRQGRTDEVYRVALKGRIISNRSIGDTETINSYARMLLGEYFVGVFPKTEPMNLNFRYTFNPYSTKQELINLMKKAVASGINIDTNIQIQVPITGLTITGLKPIASVSAII